MISVLSFDAGLLKELSQDDWVLGRNRLRSVKTTSKFCLQFGVIATVSLFEKA